MSLFSLDLVVGIDAGRLLMIGFGVGSESAIETAKEAILKIAAGRPPRGRRD